MDDRLYKCKKYQQSKPDIDCDCELCKEEKKIFGEHLFTLNDKLSKKLIDYVNNLEH